VVCAALIVKRGAEDFMTVAYPLHLPSFLKASKSRTQPASFRMTEPRRGYGYVQEIGTDTPVFWDVTWRFTRSQAVQFKLWFEVQIRRGVDEFTMFIDTEFGLVEHVCRFLPESLLPTQDTGSTWTYSATIMARSLAIPQEYIDAADLLVGLPDWQGFGGALDQAVTVEIPTVALPAVPILLDTFTAADGTDPTSRDMDVHPAYVARWSAAGGIGSDNGQIQSNSWTLFAENSSNLVVQGNAGGSIVSAFPIAFVIRGFALNNWIGMYAYSIAGSSQFCIRWINDGIEIFGDDQSGNSFSYQGGDPGGAYPLPYSSTPHSMAVWCDGSTVVIALDGASVRSEVAGISLPSLEELNAECVSDLLAPNAVESVGVYQGITLSEAIALTA
jgi:hypothetical protein